MKARRTGIHGTFLAVAVSTGPYLPGGNLPSPQVRVFVQMLISS